MAAMFKELVLLSLFITVFAQWDIMTENENKRSKVYCGDSLTKVLMLICESQYNSPLKKSYDYSSYPDYSALDSLEHSSPEYRFPFHPKARALSPFQYKRLKRGVYEECCKKSCSISEIKGYCLKKN